MRCRRFAARRRKIWRAVVYEQAMTLERFARDIGKFAGLAGNVVDPVMREFLHRRVFFQNMLTFLISLDIISLSTSNEVIQMTTKSKPAMRPLVYRLGQAADLLGISKVTLWRRIKDGTLQGVKIGPRAAGVTSASVHRLIEGASQ